MKHLQLIVFVVIGTIIMNTPPAKPQSETSSKSNDNKAAITAPPQLKHERTIDLNSMGRTSAIKRLAFSPDGRYLAIVDDPSMASSTLIIWDVKNNREQSRITNLHSAFGNLPQVEILWGPDGKYVTFGFGSPKANLPMRLWDPLTGKVLKELQIFASFAKLNRDGTKLLVSRGTQEPPTFRIYDTGTWGFNEYGIEGYIVETLTWTAGGKVIVVGTSKSGEKIESDGMITRTSDCIARLIDPTGKQATRSVVLSAGNKKTRWKNVVAITPGEYFDSSIVDYTGNTVALGSGRIKVLDGSTLETLYTYAPSDDDIKNGKMPSGFPDKAFSPDGKYFYIVGGSLDCSVKSLILDARTGTTLGSFEGGGNGFAVSRDGKQIALGKWHTVELFNVK